jgi:hypothetical protein
MKLTRARLHRREAVLLMGASILAYGCGGSDDSIKDDISSLVEKGKRESIDLMSSVIEGMGEAVKDPAILMYARNGALPSWVASIFTGSWLGNLDFDALPQSLVSYYRKAGNEYRDLVGAESIWETIPRSIRMGGPEALKEFHASRDWSHFIPRSLGAGDSGNEGIFEKKILNQIRGAKTMGVEEIAQARNALRVDSVRNAVRLVSKGSVVGSLVSVATEGTFAALENGLLFHEGKVSQSELNARILKQVASSGGLAIAVTGLALGLSIVFPPLLPVMSYMALPLAFASFMLVGSQFYSLSDEWMEQIGFAPLVEVWNELN